MTVVKTLSEAWPQARLQPHDQTPDRDFLPVSDALLAEVVRRIVVALDPEQVILFGSYAYGEPHVDSDVDLLVIMETDLPPAQRALAVCRQLRPRPFPVDILVKTPAEVAAAHADHEPFITTIVELGRVLYARAR